MLVEAILITIGGATIIWSFWWSRNERRRKAKAKFVSRLKDDTTVKDLISECERKYGILIHTISVGGIVQDVSCQEGLSGPIHKLQISSKMYKDIISKILGANYDH